MLETFIWWLSGALATRIAASAIVHIAKRWSGAVLGLILGKRFRSMRDAMVPFRRDQGRGDLAARLIETAPDFQRAESIFKDWHYDREPRAMGVAVDAMVARLHKEGETPQTEMFLNDELSALADSARQFLPKDPHDVNDPHHFEWMVMCFEGMWKEPVLFPRKD